MLAIDIGTIQDDRTLIIMARYRGGCAFPLAVITEKMLGNGSADAGRFTAANLREAISAALNNLLRRPASAKDEDVFVEQRVQICSVSADNATNLRNCVECTGAILQPCACHGFALVFAACIKSMQTSPACRIVRNRDAPVYSMGAVYKELEVWLGRRKGVAGSKSLASRLAAALGKSWTDHRDQRWLDFIRAAVDLLELWRSATDEQRQRLHGSDLQVPTAGGERETSIKIWCNAFSHLITALRICEGDAANMWNVVQALAVIGYVGPAHNDDGNLMPIAPMELFTSEEDRLDFIEPVIGVIVRRLITPSLLITAYMSPADKSEIVRFGKEIAIVSATIRAWLGTPWAQNLGSLFGASAAQLQLEFDEFEGLSKPSTMSPTRAEMIKHINVLAKSCPKLRAFIIHVMFMTCNEAAAERYFSLERQLKTDNTSSLLPTTTLAMAQCKMLIEQKAKQRIMPSPHALGRLRGKTPQELVSNRRNGAGLIDGADAKAQADAENDEELFLNIRHAITGIILAGAENIQVSKNKDRATSLRKQQHEKCKKCALKISAHPDFSKNDDDEDDAFAERLQPVYFCTMCRSLYHPSCVGINHAAHVKWSVREDALYDFTCPTCSSSNAVASEASGVSWFAPVDVYQEVDVELPREEGEESDDEW